MDINLKEGVKNEARKGLLQKSVFCINGREYRIYENNKEEVESNKYIYVNVRIFRIVGDKIVGDKLE
ncbi:MAG: hypothetical protein LBQ04_02960 [Endomicrobium sp.]|nr:hypothetical protein [Endomicrobium sp.]